MGHFDPPQIFIGFFGAIMLYNALIYAITRDPPFGWYAALTASMLGVQLVLDPSLAGLPPGQDGGLLRTFALCAYLICVVGFVSSYLHLRSEVPRVDAVLKILLVLNLGGVVLEPVLARSIAHTVADDVLLFAMLGLCLWAGLRSAAIGREDARYYVLAFAGAIAGVAINDFAEDLRAGGAFLYAFPAGVAFEALFLALALASRVRFAAYDALTGVRNRRGFEEALGCAFREAARTGSPLSLIMVDVDGFKEYNDRMGHPAGDALLRRIAHQCAACCRGRSDVFARYGGDEFAAILPGVQEREALTIAQRMRAAVLEHCPVSITTGLACSRDARSAHELLSMADAELYREKRARPERAPSHAALHAAYPR
ncbi:MAG TPA: diguanylate cyclase [Candidatus Baltobacteraceae bacterium]|nr:diguanylate cyclase [Candidatus Baltobacteraceae bacterium]